jgi:uncharacterized protein (DUF1015 family)
MRIEPLAGYRHAAGPDQSAVVAPPYDQVDEPLRDRLYAASPDNIIRLTLPRREEGREPGAAARDTLAAWRRAGRWAPDPEPSVYPYEQVYRVEGRAITRRGFVALGEVTPYGDGAVRPHERTHRGPREDRQRLLEATGSDVGLLFMLVGDPDGRLRGLAAPAGPPVAEACDQRGEIHRLWRISDPATIRAVREAMAPRPVVIADGHHRYEAALAHAVRQPAARLKLMGFFPVDGPALTILPNHRLVHGLAGFSLETLARDAAPWFEVTPLADPLTPAPTAEAITVVAAGEARRFRLRPGASRALDWPAGTSAAWRGLAVSVLHEGLLRPRLGITDAMLDARSHVDYTADRAAAVREVQAGRYQAAFLIAPTTTAELFRVVEGGELMPQKSTHFYPKLLDGLVFHLVDPEVSR